ncbi:MAG: desulforedoxin [Dehalococcoidales bacterium]|jgi:hypothetical protein|nr:desulforedoxin [Dehalococcoidales bacterium]
MTVKAIDEKCKSNVCGNEVVATKAGGDTFVCYEQDTEKIKTIYKLIFK